MSHCCCFASQLVDVASCFVDPQWNKRSLVYAICRISNIFSYNNETIYFHWIEQFGRVHNVIILLAQLVPVSRPMRILSGYIHRRYILSICQIFFYFSSLFNKKISGCVYLKVLKESSKFRSRQTILKNFISLSNYDRLLRKWNLSQCP